MGAAFDERDVNAILTGIVDVNASLARIAEDVYAIRRVLEDDDEEEAEEEVDNPPG